MGMCPRVCCHDLRRQIVQDLWRTAGSRQPSEGDMHELGVFRFLEDVPDPEPVQCDGERRPRLSGQKVPVTRPKEVRTDGKPRFKSRLAGRISNETGVRRAYCLAEY